MAGLLNFTPSGVFTKLSQVILDYLIQRFGLPNSKGTNLPYGADAFEQSNFVSGTGLAQTIKYYKGGLTGTLLVTVTNSYDTSNNLLTSVES